MRKTIIVICTAAVMMLSGCTESHIVAGGPAEPVFDIQQGIVLDWGQIGVALDELFVNSEDNPNEAYPMGVSVNYNVQPDTLTIDLTLMVQEGTTPEDAVAYADAVVRGINAEAAVQDFSIQPSAKDSFGGFFDQYTVNLIVMPDGAMSSESLWLVDMTIPAGSNEKIIPKEGAKAMETSAADEASTSEDEASMEEDDASTSAE